MTIGMHLKARRATLGLTIEELAEKAGVGENTIRQFERDETTPQARTLGKLAEALGVPVISLIQPPAPSSSSGGANGVTPAGPTVHAHTDIASPAQAGLPSLTDSSAAKPDSRGGPSDERG